MTTYPWYALGQLLAYVGAVTGLLALLVRAWRDHIARPPRAAALRSHRVGTPQRRSPQGSPTSPYVRQGAR